jgi:hypothetical protein
MHHLSQALATARIEDLHRDAALRHTIHLTRRVAHEPHLAAASKAPILARRTWTRLATAVSRRNRHPMHREIRRER